MLAKGVDGVSDENLSWAAAELLLLGGTGFLLGKAERRFRSRRSRQEGRFGKRRFFA